MRIVMHVDMDAFFAAVEERYNSQWKGKPIVVGADPKGGRGRGVVSTANYPARKYGIRSALPISKAWEFAEAAKRRGEPAAIFVSGNYQLYSEVSGRIMAILERYADRFEEASVDEAYLEWDLSPSPESPNSVWQEMEGRARSIKKEVWEKEGLTCSVGIGPNKLIAKIASDFQKPDGLTVVQPGGVQSFLNPLPVRAIPGVGPKGEAFLRGKRIHSIQDLASQDLPRLIEWFGKWGEGLWRKARGQSDSPVSNDWEPKSMGEQETFGKDVKEASPILERAKALGEDVFRRFQKEGFRSFQRVVITVRFADFTTVTRSRTLARAATTLRELQGEALRSFLPFLDKRENPGGKAIRLIGVRVEKLER